jgi:Ca2+:H+ antiporter
MYEPYTDSTTSFLLVIALQDGSSNWLKGAMLVLTYLFIAAGFWVHKDPSLTDEAR